jgi:hypothetical protein
MSMAEFTGQTYGEASRQQASQRAVRPGPPPPPGAGVQCRPVAVDSPVGTTERTCDRRQPYGGRPGTGSVGCWQRFSRVLVRTVC